MQINGNSPAHFAQAYQARNPQTSSDQPQVAQQDDVAQQQAIKSAPVQNQAGSALAQDDSHTNDQQQSQDKNAKRSANGQTLTDEEYQVIRELQQRDLEVHLHEQAHLAAAGQYATGGASFTYQAGPDGKRYAVGGEVGIDTSPIPDDPEATVRKAAQIQAAASAPADPSSQDRQVAAAAAQMAASARAEIATKALHKPEVEQKGEQTQPQDNKKEEEAVEVKILGAKSDTQGEEKAPPAVEPDAIKSKKAAESYQDVGKLAKQTPQRGHNLDIHA